VSDLIGYWEFRAVVMIAALLLGAALGWRIG